MNDYDSDWPRVQPKSATQDSSENLEFFTTEQMLMWTLLTIVIGASIGVGFALYNNGIIWGVNHKMGELAWVADNYDTAHHEFSKPTTAVTNDLIFRMEDQQCQTVCHTEGSKKGLKFPGGKVFDKEPKYVLSQPQITIRYDVDSKQGEFNGDNTPIILKSNGKQWDSYDINIGYIGKKPNSILCILFFDNNTVDG